MTPWISWAEAQPIVRRDTWLGIRVRSPGGTVLFWFAHVRNTGDEWDDDGIYTHEGDFYPAERVEWLPADQVPAWIRL